MNSRTSSTERVESTHGIHCHRYSRLRSTHANNSSASLISNCRISIPGATSRRNIGPLRVDGFGDGRQLRRLGLHRVFEQTGFEQLESRVRIVGVVEQVQVF